MHIDKEVHHLALTTANDALICCGNSGLGLAGSKVIRVRMRALFNKKESHLGSSRAQWLCFFLHK